MPLFRFHRGGLEESLSTTVIVTNLVDLKYVIGHSSFGHFSPNNDFEVKIEPYP